ncbi:4Fe-4S ferredoxin iron-sulfur binding domain-containing protein [Thermodesulfobium narugense DSM 14796]|uniref:4Fe-4S ferredoxin iron-sulfur binding domain-containing protein n=1 Tax=Thermodesulfobium narugense DSM 14796 TaxID=747365 RepID=M1E7N0_9BACT|nr:4Fe-4S binding protein [Thermodesulfobium narugense]AEE14718.1 4Fe-4S ferredoxin iron-sulfur binding domain-containing protein [Thermodesulfobium narugense DSM 14796]
MSQSSRLEPVVNRAFCKGCGICIEFCPANILEFDEQRKCRVTEPEKCINCYQCELRCPDFAIELVEKGEKK